MTLRTWLRMFRGTCHGLALGGERMLSSSPSSPMFLMFSTELPTTAQNEGKVSLEMRTDARFALAYHAGHP